MFKMFAVGNAAAFVKQNEWLLCQTVFAGYLLLLSWMDVRKRKLNLAVLLSGFPMAVLGQICFGSMPGILQAAGGAVGLVFFVVSRMTREAFGYGDSILIAIMGIFVGFWNILSVLMGAFSMAALFSIIMLIRNHFTKKSSFPFVPFLTAAYIAGMITGGY